MLNFAGFLGVLRFRRINLFRSGNATANAKHSASDAATATGAVSGAFARTDAAPVTGANAAAIAVSGPGCVSQPRAE